MLTKIKDVINTKGEIDKLNVKISDQKKEFSELKLIVSELKDEAKLSSSSIKILVKQQQALIEGINASSIKISSTSKEFEDELTDFKLMKSRLQNKISEEATSEFKKELKEYIERVKRDINDYALAKEGVEKILGTITKINVNLEKFNQVADNIKKEDFELSKFTNRVFAEDKNKLELMKQIDVLEKLIAKQRRSSNSRQMNPMRR